MLTRHEAQQLVVRRLQERHSDREIVIAEDRTIERSFGRVFFVEAVGTSKYGPIIVNKHVGQVVASIIEHEPDRLIEIYEKLLAENQGHRREWCLTLQFPFPRSRSHHRKSGQGPGLECGK